MDEEIRELYRAVKVEGINPQHHQYTMIRHRSEWPTLWAAIDKITMAAEKEGIVEAKIYRHG